MLSGPEMARLANEFEACMAPEVRPETNNHHEAERDYQAAYHKDVRSLADVLDDFGNHFEEEGKDLIVLDSKVVAEEGGVSRMQQIEDLGVKQCDTCTFISDRLMQRTKPLDDPISRHKLSFETPSMKTISKAQQQLSYMKSDCSLFSRLFIACQSRNANLDEFLNMKSKRAPHRYIVKEICASLDKSLSQPLVFKL